MTPDKGYATAAELAEILAPWAPDDGSKKVNVRNIRAWHSRRAATGFPEPAGVRRLPHVPAQAPAVWEVAQVLAWYLEWQPQKGGAPAGNTNQRGRRRRLAKGAN